MPDPTAGIVRELKRLRKGRAIFARQIADRVGPALRTIFGVADDDTPADIRRKIADRIENLAHELPEDLRLAVLAALAIHREARQPFYQDRVAWLAARLGRDERTARRRIDDAVERLAELAAAAIRRTRHDGAGLPPAWHTEDLRVSLALDQPSPEAFEYRLVVADRDDLDELDLALTFTAPPGWKAPAPLGEPPVDVFHGGTLVRRTRETTDRIALALALPRPLARTERHEYSLRYRVPQGQPMAAHYVSVLRQRCDRFTLHVRFGTGNPPPRVWRLAGVFQRDVDDPMPRGEPVALDTAGEVHLTFRNLTPGLAYGARWAWDT